MPHEHSSLLMKIFSCWGSMFSRFLRSLFKPEKASANPFSVSFLGRFFLFCSCSYVLQLSSQQSLVDFCDLLILGKSFKSQAMTSLGDRNFSTPFIILLDHSYIPSIVDQNDIRWYITVLQSIFPN